MKKKMFLGLGATTMVAIPMVAVVACGNTIFKYSFNF